jgi:hypothetical protein
MKDSIFQINQSDRSFCPPKRDNKIFLIYLEMLSFITGNLRQDDRT